MTHIGKTLLLLTCFAFTTVSIATPTILAAWEANYPNSNSNNIECQLCHEQAVVGGDGWNEYGWAIRTHLVFDGFTIQESFRLVEGLNSDFDPEGLSNITEINRSMYPGWLNDSNNHIIYFKSGLVKRNQPSPVFEIDPTLVNRNSDEFCLPIKASTNKLSLICL